MTSKKKYREKNDTSLDTNSYETDANEKKKTWYFSSFNFAVRPSAFNNEKMIQSYGFFKSSDSFRSHLRNNDVYRKAHLLLYSLSFSLIQPVLKMIMRFR